MISQYYLHEQPVARAPLTDTDHAQTDYHDLYPLSRGSSIPVRPVAIGRTTVGHEVHVYRHVAPPSIRLGR
jgi:hypothetical protein